MTDSLVDPNPVASASEQKTIDKVSPDTLRSVTTRRRTVGYWLGGGSIVGFVSLTLFSYCRLSHLDSGPWSPGDFPRHCVLIGGHVVVTAAFVFFLYQLLKAAERMVIPASWIENNPRLMGALLGVESPVAALPEISESAEKTLEAVRKVVSLKPE